MNKPFLFTILCSFFALSSGEAAVSEAQIKLLENKVRALENKQGSQAMVTQPGRPEVYGGANLFLKGDLLIWQSHENGLSYATAAKSAEPLTSALNSSETKNVHFDWDLGFRIGLGYNLPHDGWDLQTGWTHFTNHASREKVAPNGWVYLPSFLYGPSLEGATGFKQAETRWSLHLNLINLELGREFFVSRSMTLRPFISLRSGWVYQKMNDSFATSIPSTDLASAHLKNSAKFFGLGPRSGLSTEWAFGKGFSFFGDAGFSVLYGFSKVFTEQKQGYTDGSEKTPVSNYNSIRISRAISELALGLRFDRMLCREMYHLRIQAGWEHLLFFGQNQFSRFIGTTNGNAGALITNQGDLTIQGWTVSSRFDF